LAGGSHLSVLRHTHAADVVVVSCLFVVFGKASTNIFDFVASEELLSVILEVVDDSKARREVNSLTLSVVVQVAACVFSTSVAVDML